MNGEFLKALPSIFGRYGEIPADMAGARIVRFGTIPDREVDGGGLVIDYLPIAGGAKRCVFAFSEEGMWVHLIESIAV